MFPVMPNPKTPPNSTVEVLVVFDLRVEVTTELTEEEKKLLLDCHGRLHLEKAQQYYSEHKHVFLGKHKLSRSDLDSDSVCLGSASLYDIEEL